MIGHGPQLSLHNLRFHASFRPLAVKPGRQQQQQQTYIQINPRLKALTHSHLAWAVLDKSSITTPNTTTAAATTAIPGSTPPSSTSHTPSTPNTLGLEFNMTSMQAWAASSLLFDHLLRCQRQQQRSHSFPFHLGQAAGPPQLSCSPMASVAELRHPQARALLQLLARLWVAHAPAEKDLAEQLRRGSGGSGMNGGNAAGGSDSSSNSDNGFTAGIGKASGNSAGRGSSMGEGSFWKPDRKRPRAAGEHCSTPAGVQLLEEVKQAVAVLQRASCERVDGTRAHWAQPWLVGMQDDAEETHLEAGLSLPYVLLRRATMAVLQLLYTQPGDECRAAVAKVAPPVLLSFGASMNCSRAARPAVELLHISKSGGTSMCQLAAKSGLANPGANMHRNCLYPRFHDEPKWSRLEDGLPSRVGRQRVLLWPAVNCNRWPHEREATCHTRAHMASRAGMNFYANELSLHEGTSERGSAHACPEVETVVMLREPVERVRSHIIETDKVYAQFSRFGIQYKRTRSLHQWRDWAPALLDNYVIRVLLGRKFMHCLDFGSIGEEELLSASLALASIDHVLLMEKAGLNDLVMRAGLGWNHSLGAVHWRWSHQHDLHRDLGFPSYSMDLLREWNVLDGLLYTWGSTLLTLDAAFHTSVAALTGKLQPGPCGGSSGTGTGGGSKGARKAKHTAAATATLSQQQQQQQQGQQRQGAGEQGSTATAAEAGVLPGGTAGADADAGAGDQAVQGPGGELHVNEAHAVIEPLLIEHQVSHSYAYAQRPLEEQEGQGLDALLGDGGGSQGREGMGLEQPDGGGGSNGGGEREGLGAGHGQGTGLELPSGGLQGDGDNDSGPWGAMEALHGEAQAAALHDGQDGQQGEALAQTLSELQAQQGFGMEAGPDLQDLQRLFGTDVDVASWGANGIEEAGMEGLRFEHDGLHEAWVGGVDDGLLDADGPLGYWAEEGRHGWWSRDEDKGLLPDGAGQEAQEGGTTPSSSLSASGAPSSSSASSSASTPPALDGWDAAVAAGGAATVAGQAADAAGPAAQHGASSTTTATATVNTTSSSSGNQSGSGGGGKRAGRRRGGKGSARGPRLVRKVVKGGYVNVALSMRHAVASQAVLALDASLLPYGTARSVEELVAAAAAAARCPTGAGAAAGGNAGAAGAGGAWDALLAPTGAPTGGIAAVSHGAGSGMAGSRGGAAAGVAGMGGLATGLGSGLGSIAAAAAGQASLGRAWGARRALMSFQDEGEAQLGAEARGDGGSSHDSVGGSVDASGHASGSGTSDAGKVGQQDGRTAAAKALLPVASSLPSSSTSMTSTSASSSSASESPRVSSLQSTGPPLAAKASPQGQAAASTATPATAAVVLAAADVDAAAKSAEFTSQGMALEAARAKAGKGEGKPLEGTGSEAGTGRKGEGAKLVFQLPLYLGTLQPVRKMHRELHVAHHHAVHAHAGHANAAGRHALHGGGHAAGHDAHAGTHGAHAAGQQGLHASAGENGQQAGGPGAHAAGQPGGHASGQQGLNAAAVATGGDEQQAGGPGAHAAVQAGTHASGQQGLDAAATQAGTHASLMAGQQSLHSIGHQHQAGGSGGHPAGHRPHAGSGGHGHGGHHHHRHRGRQKLD